MLTPPCPLLKRKNNSQTRQYWVNCKENEADAARKIMSCLKVCELHS